MSDVSSPHSHAPHQQISNAVDATQVTLSLQEEDVLDFVGIGYGPAHLALSIALRESNEAQDSHFKALFLEKREYFAWHPALLLPGSQLQVSPLKDLVTLRDPTSTYSFFNYLHSQGRLAHYINKEQKVPSRREWTAYLAWAAKRMENVVSYGQDVVSIEPLTLISSVGDKQISLQARSAKSSELDALCLYRIVTRKNGQLSTLYTRTISLAVGGVPKLPKALEPLYHQQAGGEDTAPTTRIVHSGTYLPSLQTLEPLLHSVASDRACRAKCAQTDETRLRLAVVGAGQSATEIFMNLHSRFPTAIVTMIFRASALAPSDDTGFINSAAFDPERTDEFWQAGSAQRRTWLDEFKRTNYSVVRTDLLNELHDTLYDTHEVSLPEELQDANEKLAGRMEMRRCTEIDQARFVDADDVESAGVELTLRDKLHNDAIETIKFDAVFVGTGFFRSPAMMPCLEPLKPFYPLLNSEWADRDTSAEEDALAKLVDTEDEEVLDRRREDLRGITRDYRLVPGSQMQSMSLPSKTSPTSGVDSDASSNSSQQTLASETGVHVGDKNVSLPQTSLYVLGGNEATHGLSDSLLSIVAHRAGELTTSLMQRLPTTRNASITARFPPIPIDSDVTAASSPSLHALPSLKTSPPSQPLSVPHLHHPVL